MANFQEFKSSFSFGEADIAAAESSHRAPLTVVRIKKVVLAFVPLPLLLNVNSHNFYSTITALVEERLSVFFY